MPARRYTWAEDEWLRWCARRGRSAPAAARPMGRSPDSVAERMAEIGLAVPAPMPVGAPKHNLNGLRTRFKPGNPGRWRRAA